MTSPKRFSVGGPTAYLAAASAIIAVVFWKFLAFQAAYLFKDIGADSLNFLYPQLRHLFDYLRTDGLPGWSFNQGLGQNIFPFSWNDPFFLLLFPFRGGALPFGFAYMEAVKILTAGVLFLLFLRESGLTKNASVAGALLYSFSGYVILGGAWSVFSTEAVYCALLLYALERFLKRGDRTMVPVALAVLTLHQPFLLLPYALFFAPYAAIRLLDESGGGTKGLAGFLLSFAGLSLLGVAIGGVFLLPDLRQMLQSPRAAGAASRFRTLSAMPLFRPSDPVQGVTALLRLYSNDLLGTGSDYRGWGNYMEAPLFYCGLSALLLAPQAFASMNRRRRTLYGALAALVVLPAVFPYFRRAFWGFSGDYYRSLSLFLVVVLLFLAMTAFSRIEESSSVDGSVLAISLAAALVLLYAVPTAFQAPVDEPRRFVVALLLVFDAVLISALGSKKYARLAVPALILLMGGEAAWSARRTIDSRGVLTAADLAAGNGYNDSTVDALAALRGADKSFYRVEKNYRSNPTPYRGFNDAKAQGYFGTASYAQFNSPSYVAFLSETGVLDPSKESDTRWIRGLRSREKLMTLVGVKYFLARGTAGVPPRFAADPVGTFGGVTVYLNRRALPLAFTYDRCLALDEFRVLDGAGKDAALLDAFVAEDSSSCLGFPAFSSASAPRGEARRYDASIRARAADVFVITARSQNSIVGNIELGGRKLLFFSIPFDEGWRATVDGKPAALARVSVGFMGLPLEPGAHRVELRYAPPLRALGAGVSLAGLGIYGFLFARRRRRA